MPVTSPYYNNKTNQSYNDIELNNRLSSDGVAIEIGPFCVNVSIKFQNVRDEFIKIYRDFPFYADNVVWDNYLKLYGQNFYRQYIKPQAFVELGMSNEFIPLPASMGMVSLEMGLNWHVAYTCRQYVMFHAGVVAKDGVGLVMPAMSGSGKSTLAAGLSYRGWQLHSDEFGLFDVGTGELVPYPRAVSLKNQSIPVMKKWVREVDDNYMDYFSDEYQGTPKGTICYMRPSADSIKDMHKRTKPNVVILPVYDANAEPAIKPISKTMAFFRLVMSSANYGDVGKDAFLSLSKIIDDAHVCEIIYPTLEDAVDLVEKFVADNVNQNVGDE